MNQMDEQSNTSSFFYSLIRSPVRSFVPLEITPSSLLLDHVKTLQVAKLQKDLETAQMRLSNEVKMHATEIRKLRQQLQEEKDRAQKIASSASAAVSSSSAASAAYRTTTLTTTALLNDSLYRQKLLAMKTDYDKEIYKLKKEMQDLRNEVDKRMMK